jgi:2-aminophenol/2-amino-5-chlorophenol 1,6-dioxygenase alpha subunit
MTIVARAWVSAAPQMMKPEMNGSYQDLVDSCRKLAKELEAKGVERIVYWSTQWLSVLGQMYQAGSDLKGVHVDENWHDLADLPFDFCVDRDLASELCKAGAGAGYPGQTVDFRGFPVDTATIIADGLINKKRVPVTMIACNVYCDGAKTRALAATLSRVLENRKEKIAVIAVSLVTTSFHTTTIDLREDHIRGASEQRFLTDFVHAVETAKWDEVDKLFVDQLPAIRSDMGLRAIEWLAGSMPNGIFDKGWKVYGKGALYGASGIIAEI